MRSFVRVRFFFSLFPFSLPFFSLFYLLGRVDFRDWGGGGGGEKLFYAWHSASDATTRYIYTGLGEKNCTVSRGEKRRTAAAVPLTVFDPGNNGQLEQTVAVCETIRATPCYPNTNRLYSLAIPKPVFRSTKFFFPPGEPRRDC